MRASYLTLVMTPVGAPRGTAFLNHIPIAAVFTTNFVGTCRADGQIRRTQPTFSGMRAVKGLNKKMLDAEREESARKARDDLRRLGVPMHEDDEPFFDEDFDEMLDEMIEEWIEEELEEEREFEDWLDQLQNDEGESEGQ